MTRRRTKLTSLCNEDSLIELLPLLRKQLKSVECVGKIRARTKCLQADADAVVETAHDTVERSILGS